jgi:hypothetical protein
MATEARWVWWRQVQQIDADQGSRRCAGVCGTDVDCAEAADELRLLLPGFNKKILFPISRNCATAHDSRVVALAYL